MKRLVGTMSLGVRCPIIKKGDDLTSIIPDAVINSVKSIGLNIDDKDVIAITESIVARASGNYASVDDIASDIKNKYNDSKIGVIFPILSRNRFAICLKGIARGSKEIVLMLSYPSDEVGNELIPIDKIDEKNINPYTDTLSLDEYRKLFGDNKHVFTNVDYVAYYKKLIEDEGCKCDVIFSNNPKAILKYTDSVLNCDIHTRFRTRKILKEAGAKLVYGLDEVLNNSINGSGYNTKYGLLGSNKASEDSVKLFPNDPSKLVNDIKKIMFEKTNKNVEVMIYGDGAFKDPQGKIWELADPCVSPAYTDGLKGTPNELKLKYLADNEYKDLSGEELKQAIEKSIKNKENNLKGNMASEGTTPRQITDLLGSLSDLTSGSGDKGTPVVLIKGYFDNYAND